MPPWRSGGRRWSGRRWSGGRAKRPPLGCNDAWQLTIDTSTTTIVTVLMVFLIRNSRNRDTADQDDEMIARLDGPAPCCWTWRTSTRRRWSACAWDMPSFADRARTPRGAGARPQRGPPSRRRGRGGALAETGRASPPFPPARIGAPAAPWPVRGTGGASPHPRGNASTAKASGGRPARKRATMVSQAASMCRANRAVS
ncbi:low affinity iron permease family protein [Xanthobacter autotrophicus DSM 431]|uniref:low affinity iron permease family protein n=1 Tax=Xanthobacter nonsaccharivorans TaxID=3119912 RepID=UPI00372C0B67